MKTSRKISVPFWFAGLASVIMGYHFFALGFLFLHFIVELVYAKDLDTPEPTDEKSWIFVVNRFNVLREKVKGYAGKNDAEIFQAETDKFHKIFLDHFKGEKAYEHMEIKVNISLTNRNEIECRAEAKTDEGINCIRLFNNSFDRALKVLENKDK